MSSGRVSLCERLHRKQLPNGASTYALSAPLSFSHKRARTQRPTRVLASAAASSDPVLRPAERVPAPMVTPERSATSALVRPRCLSVPLCVSFFFSFCLCARRDYHSGGVSAHIHDLHRQQQHIQHDVHQQFCDVFGQFVQSQRSNVPCYLGF